MKGTEIICNVCGKAAKPPAPQDFWMFLQMAWLKINRCGDCRGFSNALLIACEPATKIIQ